MGLVFKGGGCGTVGKKRGSKRLPVVEMTLPRKKGNLFGLRDSLLPACDREETRIWKG